jgi:hypothetical protein
MAKSRWMLNSQNFKWHLKSEKKCFSSGHVIEYQTSNQTVSYQIKYDMCNIWVHNILDLRARIALQVLQKLAPTRK